jgi:hypothetical protein
VELKHSNVVAAGTLPISRILQFLTSFKLPVETVCSVNILVQAIVYCRISH